MKAKLDLDALLRDLDALLRDAEEELKPAREAPERCTGHCCERFFLPASPETLKEMAAAYKDCPELDRQQYAKVADMVVLLEVAEDGAHFYTCRHHDPATGDCRIYADRPPVCSEYPYGKQCTYKGCTMRGGCGVVDPSL